MDAVDPTTVCIASKLADRQGGSGSYRCCIAVALPAEMLQAIGNLLPVRASGKACPIDLSKTKRLLP